MKTRPETIGCYMRRVAMVLEVLGRQGTGEERRASLSVKSELRWWWLWEK
jgi:hypothetical protein